MSSQERRFWAKLLSETALGIIIWYLFFAGSILASVVLSLLIIASMFDED